MLFKYIKWEYFPNFSLLITYRRMHELLLMVFGEKKGEFIEVVTTKLGRYFNLVMLILNI